MVEFGEKVFRKPMVEEKMLPWIFLEMILCSDEFLVGRRNPPAECGDGEFVNSLSANISQPGPMTILLRTCPLMSKCTSQPVVTETQLRPVPVLHQGAIGTKRIYIRREDELVKCGFAMGCESCQMALQGKPAKALAKNVEPRFTDAIHAGPDAAASKKESETRQEKGLRPSLPAAPIAPAAAAQEGQEIREIDVEPDSLSSMMAAFDLRTGWCFSYQQQQAQHRAQWKERDPTCIFCSSKLTRDVSFRLRIMEAVSRGSL